MKNVSESVLALVKGDKIATNTQEVFMYSPGQETLLFNFTYKEGQMYC